MYVCMYVCVYVCMCVCVCVYIHVHNNYTSTLRLPYPPREEKKNRSKLNASEMPNALIFIKNALIIMHNAQRTNSKLVKCPTLRYYQTA